MNSIAKTLCLGLVLTFVTMPSSLSALVGKALRLDGIDDFVETPNAPGLHMGNELTVTGWFRVDDLDGGTQGWQNLFCKGEAPDRSPYNMREYCLQLNESGFLKLEATPESRQELGYLSMQTKLATIKEGHWQHFAAIISASQNQMQLYVNGLLMTSNSFDPTGMRDTAGPLQLGRVADRDHFGGMLDEVQFWNRPLSQAEVEQNMNRTLTGMETGLVAYYDFDELDAYGMVPDRSGNGHRLYLRNGARIVAAETAIPLFARSDTATLQGAMPRDLFVRSLSLDGQGDYLEIPTATAMAIANQLTVEAWIRPESFNKPWQAVFFKGGIPHSKPFPHLDYSLWIQGQGQLHLASAPQGHSQRLALDTHGQILHLGEWQHLAAVIDAVDNRMSIYVNGVLQVERNYAATGMQINEGPLKIGTGYDQGDFHGQLDEVRLWNRALSAVEIAKNMERLPSVGEAGLVGRYAFDAVGVGGIVADLSGHGHDGLLRGDAHLTSVHVAQLAVSGPIQGAAADLLILALRHHDSGVRRRAVKGLDKVGRYDFNRVMDVALQHHDAWVRQHAAQTLAHTQLSALPMGTRDRALVIALNHWDAVVRRSAVAALDQLPLADATMAMKIALGHHDTVVRRRAADILARAEYASLPAELEREMALGQTEVEHHHPHERRWDPDNYRGWERRWEAPQATIWNLEPEGLMGRYNRVEGGYLAWHLPRAYHAGAGLANYGEVGYSLGQEDFSYRAGAEVFSFYNPANARDNLVTIGGEIHDQTDTQDGWLISAEENSADAAFFRRDFRDYYRRTGWSVYTGHNFGGSLQVTGRYGWDEFASLSNSVDWVAFDSRFTRGSFRPNPAVDEVQIRSLRADIQLDTRNNRHHPSQGWFANAMFERAGGVLSGDAEFKRYLGDLRRYQPIGRGTRVDCRLRLATAKGLLPSQYLYDLGGLSTLRGYGFKEFTGDRMVLFNAEYWIDGDAHWRHGSMPFDDLSLGVFFDVGSAWFAADAQNPFDRLDYLIGQPGRVGEDLDLQKSFGFGVEMGDSRLSIARALAGKGRGWEFAAGFGRTF